MTTVATANQSQLETGAAAYTNGGVAASNHVAEDSIGSRTESSRHIVGHIGAGANLVDERIACCDPGVVIADDLIAEVAMSDRFQCRRAGACNGQVAVDEQRAIAAQQDSPGELGENRIVGHITFGRQNLQLL